MLGTFRTSALGKLAVTSVSNQSFRMVFSGNPRLNLPRPIAESPEKNFSILSSLIIGIIKMICQYEKFQLENCQRLFANFFYSLYL